MNEWWIATQMLWGRRSKKANSTPGKLQRCNEAAVKMYSSKKRLVYVLGLAAHNE